MGFCVTMSKLLNFSEACSEYHLLPNMSLMIKIRHDKLLCQGRVHGKCLIYVCCCWCHCDPTPGLFVFIVSSSQNDFCHIFVHLVHVFIIVLK